MRCLLLDFSIKGDSVQFSETNLDNSGNFEYKTIENNAVYK